MTELEDKAKISGHVTGTIIHKSGEVETISFPNAILKKGREALAASLANEIGDAYDFYISRMIFGDSGTVDGVTKTVNTERNGLFGVTRVSKPVISSIDPDIPSQVIFTSVVSYSEGNGYALNEMALRMNNGDLYSMVTFPDLNKTENVQIVFNWRISLV